jgi:hypothetical protein
MCRGVWFEFYILNSIFDQKYKDCYILYNLKLITYVKKE